jgi:hypothetical protein
MYISFVLVNLRGYNAKGGREYIFKPTIENKSLHETSDDVGLD